MYGFPVWRRLPFIGVLALIFLISYAPATTQGTATVRLSALSAPSVIRHVFVRVSMIEMHREGYPSGIGWTNVSQSFPVVDLLSPTSQPVAQTISSASVHSGRYDAVRILFTNATLVIAGVRAPAPLSPPSPLHVNATLLVSPSGVGDLLLVVGFDYESLLSTTPSLSFVLVGTSST
jgi:hypothetical protein